jgi:hypothetical protein
MRWSRVRTAWGRITPARRRITARRRRVRSRPTAAIVRATVRRRRPVRIVTSGTLRIHGAGSCVTRTIRRLATIIGASPAVIRSSAPHAAVPGVRAVTSTAIARVSYRPHRHVRRRCRRSRTRNHRPVLHRSRRRRHAATTASIRSSRITRSCRSHIQMIGNLCAAQ